MRPLSPSHLQASFATDGSLDLSWIPRSRLAWSWIDEVEAPPDPAVQGYRLRIAGPTATIERDSNEEQMALAAAEAASLGTGPIEVQVRQIGVHALSRPETIIINA
jgi:hypothetical protein